MRPERPPPAQVVSCDAKGFIRYWDCDAHDFPASRCEFTSYFATDLTACVVAKCVPKSITVAPGGARFVVCSSDCVIRVFSFRSGKCVRSLDESLEARAGDGRGHGRCERLRHARARLHKPIAAAAGRGVRASSGVLSRAPPAAHLASRAGKQHRSPRLVARPPQSLSLIHI